MGFTVKEARALLDAHLIRVQGAKVVDGSLLVEGYGKAIQYAKEDIRAQLMRDMAEYVAYQVVPLSEDEHPDMRVTGEVLLLTAKQYHFLLACMSRGKTE